MSPSLEHQRQSKVKSFLQNLLPSKSRKLASSSSQHSRTQDLSRPISISPGNVSSDTDLFLKTYTASTPKSSLGHTGPDSQSLMIQATGKDTSHSLPDHVELECTTKSTPGTSSDPASSAESGLINKHGVTTADPTYRHGQGSMTKQLLAWHGVKQLLKRIETFLDGTLAKAPVSVLNTIIDIGEITRVVLSNV
ncbi:hypothetical protein AX14_010343 [Amanita brunnescens Koide BX004]|nr:hypothetical protein AX14_010343 [Amanita brunnescens Koide BX004]